VDVYELDYGKTLTKNYADQNLLMQSLRLLSGIITNLPRLLAAFSPRNRAKEFTEKLQLFYALFIMCFLLFYMLILIMALFDTLRQSPKAAGDLSSWLAPVQAVAQEPSSITPSARPPTANPNNGTPPAPPLSPFQAMVVLLAAAKALLPKFKQKLTRGALGYISAIDYINLGERRDVIAGQLEDLLEHIAAKGTYRRIHLVAYSFGALVALDNLFPAGREPGQRFKLVHTLVTIGCPFDLIRLFWPHYFLRRQALEKVPQRWLNVYSPVDILSSNFRNDNKQDVATTTLALAETGAGALLPENVAYTKGVNTEDLSVFAWLSLLGIRAHAMYWEAQYESEVSCFSVLTAKMFKNDLLLG